MRFVFRVGDRIVIDGWSYREAVDTLNVPITTLTNEATRGLRKLREHMNSSAPDVS